MAAGGARRRRRDAPHRRRALSPRRRPHRPGRSHHGAAQGCARRAAPRSTSTPRSPAVERTASGEWRVHTNKGDITAEHVVLRDRQLRAPDRAHARASTCRRSRSSTSTSSTTSRPELKAYRKGGGRELAVLRESDQSYYLREERMGWILGPYEKGAPARFADGVPDWFGTSLFPGDLERLRAARRGGARGACRRSRTAASRTSSTARSPTPRTAARSSDRPGACATCG